MVAGVMIHGRSQCHTVRNKKPLMTLASTGWQARDVCTAWLNDYLLSFLYVWMEVEWTTADPMYQYKSENWALGSPTKVHAREQRHNRSASYPSRPYHL